MCALCIAGTLSALRVTPARAAISPDGVALFLDFAQGQAGLAFHGARLSSWHSNAVLEFATALQYAEVTNWSRRLDGLDACSIGGWFFVRRRGEQCFLFRGLPEVAPHGERMFRPQNDWVNFVLGTDERGFLLGTINGNGVMPFPLVTVDELGIDAWHQLALVKDREGFHSFYHNGALVHSDRAAANGGRPRPFRDAGAGENVRLAVPLGGLVGEAWIFPRALRAEEVRADFETKRSRYHPALPPTRVWLRPMNEHPAAGLWRTPITRGHWTNERARIERGARTILGLGPTHRVSLAPQMHSETDCGSYLRRKISIEVQPGDRMPFWLLVPKQLRKRLPAIICLYGTTSGAGKDTTVGLSGRVPGTPSQRNAAFALDIVEAGFVALAPDLLRDGERLPPSKRPYDTADFYARYPEWSVHGKDLWDIARAIDYLETVEFVDANRIGVTGHSYGGHTTIFAAAMEPRLKVAVANGPVSDFLHHGLHWAVPRGGGASQSMPGLRPYVLDHTLPLPATFYEFTALIAPRPLLVGQAAGERRPMEEENCAAVSEVYRALGHGERVRYVWYAGDHDYPPEMRAAAVEWFRQWLN